MTLIVSSCSRSSSSSPPWEVLVLIARHMDPKTLAITSCVSKAWSTAMSSDHLWRPLCAAEFPSLASLTADAVSRRRLYSLGRAAAAARRRQAPSKPRLAVADLAFAVTVTAAKSGANLVSAFNPCAELAADPNGVFVFDLAEANTSRSSAISRGECGIEFSKAPEEVRVAWSVVLDGWRGVFTLMECEGKVSVAPGAEGWFSAELPLPGCCAGAASAGSGIVADLKLGFGGGGGGGGGGGRVWVEKVSVGILSVVNWRYVTVEDALRYLQHFLLPPL